jgi:murein DD-endopeptidase MepM/ murein hydrolase activator NlpD
MLRLSARLAPWRRRGFGCLALAAPLVLAGVFPMSPQVSERWGWSGAWLQPVGDPHVVPISSNGEEAAYRVMRSVEQREAHERGHQGADLSNGRGGGPVRAAGNGLVVKVGGKGWNRGYGRHVVLAHRLSDGAIAYSVYAHLAPGSVTVRQGQFVSAGRMIGKVGMTGRATSPHLHFEIRMTEDPRLRWEKAPVVDPLAFVDARIAAPRSDSAWARPYLAWAECAALIQPGEDGHRTVSRKEWWQALAAATKHSLDPVPADQESLRTILVQASLLPGDARGDREASLGWKELARDLRRAREQGLRLPWSPVARAARLKDCRRELGVDSPARDPAFPTEGHEGRPTRADVCLALADLAGDEPATAARPRGSRSARRAPGARAIARAAGDTAGVAGPMSDEGHPPASARPAKTKS